MDESSDPSMGENAPSFKRARKQVNYIETSSSVDSEDEDTNDTDDDYEREVKSSSRRKTLRKKRMCSKKRCIYSCFLLNTLGLVFVFTQV